MLRLDKGGGCTDRADRCPKVVTYTSKIGSLCLPESPVGRQSVLHQGECHEYETESDTAKGQQDDARFWSVQPEQHPPNEQRNDEKHNEDGNNHTSATAPETTRAE